jgi:hypothetical protein
MPVVLADLGATAILTSAFHPVVLADLGATAVFALAFEPVVLADLGATTVFASALPPVVLTDLGTTAVFASAFKPVVLADLGATALFAIAFPPAVLAVPCQLDTSGAGVGDTEPSGQASFVRLRRPDPRSARHQNKTVLTRRFPSLLAAWENEVQSPPFHLERVPPSAENLGLW